MIKIKSDEDIYESYKEIWSDEYANDEKSINELLVDSNKLFNKYSEYQITFDGEKSNKLDNIENVEVVNAGKILGELATYEMNFQQDNETYKNFYKRIHDNKETFKEILNSDKVEKK